MAIKEDSNYGRYDKEQLYNAYFRINRERYPENFKEIVSFIKIQFHLPEEQEINDEYVKSLYSDKGIKVIEDFTPVIKELDDSASRSDRFIAAVKDLFIVVLIFLVVLMPFGLGRCIMFVYRNFILGYFISFVLLQIIFILCNGYLLNKAGQTIGKKFIGIKITDKYGNIPSFGMLYFLRYCLPIFIEIFPFYGWFLFVADSLFIFEKSKLCLHDYIASTKVMKV